MLSLYLHIPFCAARCPYCDFAIALDGAFAPYAEALIREARLKGKGERVTTIHLGGGTPSRMPPDLLDGILAAVREAFDVAPGAEIALEMNPEDLGRAAAWRAMGVNRLSIGAQSFDDAELASLGRGHTAARTAEAVREAREAGFRNVGVDLIYGLPGQGLPGWKGTLEAALSLSPEHVSVYALTLSGAKRLPGPPLPCEEAQAAMASLAMDRLEAAGLAQYEISNFARAGFESRHNLACWTGRPYLGLGAGAHSFLPPRRFSNVAQAPAYVARVLGGQSPVGMEETLTGEQAALERLFLGLRRPAGAAWEGLPEGVRQEARSLEGEGLVACGAEGVSLTRRGRLLCDAVTARLLGRA